MVKEYEEHATMTSAEVLKSGINEILDRVIHKLAQPMIITEQLLGEDTKLMEGGGKIRRLRKEKTRISMQDFNEDADIPDVGVADRWEYDDFTPTYFGGGEPLTGQAIGDADFDLLQEELEAFAEGMAIRKDARAWAEILNTTIVIDEAIAGGATEFDLAKGPLTADAILAVTDVTVTNATTWQLDYLRGHIKFAIDPGASTISYIYATDRLYIEAGTPGDIGWNDIVNMMTGHRAQFVSPDTIVFDPFSESLLLKDDKFLEATFLDVKAILNGSIGRKVAGADIIRTDTLYDNVPVTLIRGPKFGYTIYKKKMQAKTIDLDKRPDDQWIQTWEKSIVGILRANYIRVLINAQVNAYDSTA